MKRQNIVIVGGGLSGLYAANKLAATNRFDITLIESGERCGGLLNSFKSSRGINYDQGTHLASMTGVAHIDKVLFGDNANLDDSWQKFAYLNSGNFFAGSWNYDTQVVDVRNLPLNDYQTVLGEIFTSNSNFEEQDFKRFTRSHLGSYLQENLFIPAVEKLYGKDVDFADIKPYTGYFGLNRVVAFDDEVTCKLKSIECYDQKLAYSSSKTFSQKMATIDNFLYPKQAGGIEFWVNRLLDNAVAQGVDVLTKTNIVELKTLDKQVSAIKLDNGSELACDHIIWTAPPIVALKLANVEFASNYRPVLRTANIFHFMFDQPILNNVNHYVWNWDKDFRSFRITIYDNFCQSDNAKHRLTVEVLSSPSESEQITQDLMLQELAQLKLIQDNYVVLDSAKQTIHNTFPVPTKQLDQAVSSINEVVTHQLKNVLFAGRHSSSAWLQTDVIKAIDKQIDDIIL